MGLPPSFRQFIEILFQNIALQNFNIVIVCETLFQNRNQRAVYLDRENFSGPLCEMLGQGADAGTYLQHSIFFRQLRRCRNPVQHMAVNQKILPELLLKTKLRVAL